MGNQFSVISAGGSSGSDSSHHELAALQTLLRAHRLLQIDDGLGKEIPSGGKSPMLLLSHTIQLPATSAGGSFAWRGTSPEQPDRRKHFDRFFAAHGGGRVAWDFDMKASPPQSQTSPTCTSWMATAVLPCTTSSPAAPAGGGKHNAPTSRVVRDRRLALTRERHAHRFTSRRRAPDRHGHVGLQGHVVGKQR